MGSLLLKLLSFLVAIAFYLLLLLSIFLLLTQNDKKNIEIKDSKIDVFLENPKKSKMAAKKVEKSGKKSKKSSSKSPKRVESQNLKDLFSSISGKKYSPKLAKEPQKITPSRLKSKKSKEAKKLLKELNANTPSGGAKKSIKSISGEKDEYLQKVYKILYTNWIPSKLSAGNSARVKIIIDRYGNFDYKIISSSPSPTFNQELEDYLEYLKTLTFPKPKERKILTVRFEAKD